MDGQIRKCKTAKLNFSFEVRARYCTLSSFSFSCPFVTSTLSNPFYELCTADEQRLKFNTLSQSVGKPNKKPDNQHNAHHKTFCLQSFAAAPGGSVACISSANEETEVL